MNKFTEEKSEEAFTELVETEGYPIGINISLRELEKRFGRR